MPRRSPPHVEHWPDRHGKMRFYFRRGRGKRVPLPSIGSPEFEEAYAAALAGHEFRSAQSRYPGAPGTIGALVTSYRRYGDYSALRATTKKGYASRLAVIEVEHGHRSVAGLTNERVRKMLAPYADRPGAALSLLKMFRILIKHAIAIKWLTADPSVGIRRPKIGEVRSWTEEELATFEERWPIGTRERLAFALHLFTGQRRSDVHRMTWADISQGESASCSKKQARSCRSPCILN